MREKKGRQAMRATHDDSINHDSRFTEQNQVAGSKRYP